MLQAGARPVLGGSGADRPPEVYGWPSPGAGAEPETHEWAGPAVPGRVRPRARHARPSRAPGLAAPPARTVPAQVPQGCLILLVAGAHGGAGTSTLARLLRDELAAKRSGSPLARVMDKGAIPDAHPQLLAAAGLLPLPAPGEPLIVVARGTPEGARRAVTALAALERRRIRPAALAVIADGAGPEPRLSVQRFGLIAGRCGPLIRVPFAAPLRAGIADDAPAAEFGRRFHRTIASLAAAAGLMPDRAW